MILLLACAAYLALMPVPIEPVAWRAPAATGFTGAYAANDRLSAARTLSLGGEAGPESIAIGPDGRLYMGTAGGRILRMAQDGSARDVVADTGGRPLGLAFDGQGTLIVADATRGLLAIDANGRQTVLSKAARDGDLMFPDGVAVSKRGIVYVTDASRRFMPGPAMTTQEAALLDILEQSASGRVLAYDPANGSVRVVATGFSFPNGVALGADETRLFVSESGRYRVWDIAADAEGIDVSSPSTPPVRARVLLDNLPGFPDNLTRGLDGRIWLGLAGPRNALDAMAAHPFLRRMMLRIPRALWPAPKAYGHVIAFKEDGTVVASLQDPSGRSPSTTGATETAHGLYIQSVDGAGVGWLAHPLDGRP